MTAHIRLVSSEDEERPGLDGEAIAVDEAPVGLPEEAGPDKGVSTEFSCASRTLMHETGYRSADRHRGRSISW